MSNHCISDLRSFNMKKIAQKFHQYLTITKFIY